MRKLMLASTVLLLVVGQAMAQSQVFMELEVGGSNNGASCENRVYFTPGSNLNFGEGDPVQGAISPDANGHITWAVRLHASGTQPGGLEIRGVANYVFDLELYSMPNPAQPENLVLAESATFTSTANANPGSCGNEGNPEMNPTAPFLTNAAFPYTFNISYTVGTNYGPGRIFDVWRNSTSDTKGGPRMDVHCYPKAAPGTGKLFGMGGGYSSWVRTVGSTITFGGIGKGDWPTPNVYPNPHTGCVGDASALVGCQGWGPVAEGQLEGLDPGTYVLRLIPGGGVNVLRNEAGSSGKDVFALAADTVTGDDIVFVVATPPSTEVLEWKSVKTHGTTDPVELAIPLNWQTGQNATTEPRSGRGGSTGDPVGIAKIVMSTSGSTPELVSPLPGTWGGLTVTGASVNGSDVVVTLSGCVNQTCYTFEASEIIANLADPAADSADCKVLALLGDTNNTRSVNASDYIGIRNVQTQLADENNCRADPNCSKSINATDYITVRNNQTGATAIQCMN